jgi:5-formyltetrahydrofolate cyclo-ligase
MQALPAFLYKEFLYLSCMDKKELRREMGEKAKAADPLVCSRLSEQVALRVEALPQFRAARTVALYSATAGEVSLSTLIGRWMGEKTLLLPAVDGNDMFFREFNGSTPMRRGPFGIMEPAVGEAFPPRDIDLIVVPGVAFSRCRQRLGRGKGFYDKFLPQTGAYKAGVCFEAHLVDIIACDPHDIEMDIIVTPKGVF